MKDGESSFGLEQALVEPTTTYPNGGLARITRFRGYMGPTIVDDHLFVQQSP